MEDQPSKDESFKLAKKEAVERFTSLMTQVREQAGFSVQSAALASRISQPFLHALESGEFAQLPGTVFGRGFIRSLCRVYHRCDAEKQLLELFEQACGETGYDSTNSSLAVKEDANSTLFADRNSKWQWRRWARLLRGFNPGYYFRAVPLYTLQAGLVLIGLLVYFVYSSTPWSQLTEESPSTVKLADIGGQPSSSPSAVAENLEVVTKASDSVERQSPKRDFEDEAVTDNGPLGVQKVFITFPKENTLKVKIDEKVWVTRRVKASDQLFEFENSADFYLYDPEGVHIEFNGQPIGLLKGGTSRKRISFMRKHLELTKQGL